MSAAAAWAGVQIGGAVLGGIGRARGNRGQEAAQRDQADLVRQTTAEAARRMERGQDRVLGEARAGVYASGLEMSGTSERYVQDMQAEQARELAWLKEAGESQARAIEKGASVQRQAGRWSNIGQTSRTIGRAVSGFYG